MLRPGIKTSPFCSVYHTYQICAQVLESVVVRCLMVGACEVVANDDIVVHYDCHTSIKKNIIFAYLL